MAAANGEDWVAAETAAKALDQVERSEDFYQAFVNARRLAAQGRCTEATLLFDALTLSRPYFILGHEGAFLCLEARGDKAGALARLDAMLAVLPDGPQREVVFRIRQNFEASTRPVFNLFGDISASSNVNRQTTETSLGGWVIAPEAQQKPGNLVRAGASMTTHLLSYPGMDAASVVSAELGYDTSDNLLEPRLTLELPVTFSDLAPYGFALTPFATTAFRRDNISHAKAGLRAILSADLGDTAAVSLAVTSGYAAFPQQPFRDGWEHDMVLQAFWSATPETLVSGAIRTGLVMTNDVDQRRAEMSATARIDQSIAGFLLGGQVEAGIRLHAVPAPLSTGSNQTDRFVAAKADIGHRDFALGPFIPQLYYQYRIQDSDNVFFRYTSHDVGLGLRTRF